MCRVRVGGGARASGERRAWGIVMILLFSNKERELQGRGVRSAIPMHILGNGEGDSLYHIPSYCFFILRIK